MTEETKLLTEEEALAEAKKTVDRLAEKAKNRNKTLKDLLATTGGKLQLPKPNLNALAIIESELGGLSGVNTGNITTIRTMLWALLNQDNDEILNFNLKQKEEAYFAIGKEVTMDILEDVIDSITEVLDLEPKKGNPPKSTRKKAKKKK